MQAGKIDSEWFLQQLQSCGKRRSDLARSLGMDRSAVTRLLRGERKMSAEEQDLIAAFLGVSIEEISSRRRGSVVGFGEEKQSGYVTKGKGETTGQSDKEAVHQAYRHPIFGCMKGTMTIPSDLDLTAPVDPDWGKVYDDD